MALEIEGNITQFLGVQRGTSARGAWAKQDFVLEYQEGNFPSSVCMSVWGEDKVNDLSRYHVGDKVKVSFNLSSREYNGRWYTEARAWRISSVQEERQMQQAQMQQAPMPSAVDMPTEDSSEYFTESDEDLPF